LKTSLLIGFLFQLRLVCYILLLAQLQGFLYLLIGLAVSNGAEFQFVDSSPEGAILIVDCFEASLIVVDDLFLIFDDVFGFGGCLFEFVGLLLDLLLVVSLLYLPLIFLLLVLF
jgi:hypothetical protein